MSVLIAVVGSHEIRGSTSDDIGGNGALTFTFNWFNKISLKNNEWNAQMIWDAAQDASKKSVLVGVDGGTDPVKAEEEFIKNLGENPSPF